MSHVERCEIMAGMAVFPLIPSLETAGLTEDVRQLFEDLGNTLTQEERAYSGECHPALDVLETDAAVEVSVDVAGINADALRVLFRSGVLLIVGAKAPAPATGEQSFHLVERAFGRFARAVRLSGSYDVPNARATLAEGELTIVIPKRDDRRGRSQRIPIGTR